MATGADSRNGIGEPRLTVHSLLGRPWRLRGSEAQPAGEFGGQVMEQVEILCIKHVFLCGL